jgi:hypothetical protein
MNHVSFILTQGSGWAYRHGTDATEKAIEKTVEEESGNMATYEQETEILAQWSRQLAQALEIPELNLDQELFLDLARRSADSVIHAAAPVTAFLVGYAAGRQHMGGADASESVSKAASVAFDLCDNFRED